MAAKALSFDVGDYVVYPKHGVGRVIELQSTDIAGMKLELYVLRFEKERMTLRVPTNKAESVGMRKLSSDKTMQEALTTLKGKPKVKRTMWSRRAQEYEAKINSGDLASIAEVVRDLFRPDDAPEQSYSERQIFEAASTRLARELAAMEQTDEATALAKILDILNKAVVWTCQGQGTGPRRLRPCAQDETKGAAPATVPPFSLVAPLAELVY
jgi:CarD family transcriptional regulator